MRLTPRGRRPDDGVSLIELLVAIVLLGVIAVPLGNAVISFFRNTNATTNRLAESHDSQISSAYFAQDVQSIGVRAWGTIPPRCPPPWRPAPLP
jgi:prepilin-type N-terminal cleavage/methylation domain-containing protein